MSDRQNHFPLRSDPTWQGHIPMFNGDIRTEERITTGAWDPVRSSESLRAFASSFEFAPSQGFHGKIKKVVGARNQPRPQVHTFKFQGDSAQLLTGLPVISWKSWSNMKLIPWKCQDYMYSLQKNIQTWNHTNIQANIPYISFHFNTLHYITLHTHTLHTLHSYIPTYLHTYTPTYLPTHLHT